MFAQPSDSNDSQEKEKEVLVDVKEFSTPPTAKKLKRSMDPVEEKLVALIEVAQVNCRRGGRSDKHGFHHYRSKSWLAQMLLRLLQRLRRSSSENSSPGR